jgi:uncharacterized glyoxalase superfamily protein PhnB
MWAILGAAIALFAFAVNFWIVQGPYPGYKLLAYPGIVTAGLFSDEIDFWPKLGIMLLGQYLAYFVLIFVGRLAGEKLISHNTGDAMNQSIRSLSTYLFVNDVDASIRFYALVGMSVERVSGSFGRTFVGNEVVLELGTAELTASYDPRYVSPVQISKGTINFELESSEAVDKKYEELTESGYQGHLAPIDAMWQARFAIVLDPDGNQVGLHSPRNLEQDRQREQGGT